ncbi:hypothetical protein J1N10_08200 [Carboxylicivirga sp. A043]|uniref:DUF6452 family protein n=1 Tax=Carboxylicivirga litoralis TaxID=2816963 RepID=UPI0021CB24D9|nr:DUF6452 family protein [Carboxylicivirga sp. A043]MCU4155955.1 hypothetical protein [Carboxylicivirga sp. A043]
MKTKWIGLPLLVSLLVYMAACDESDLCLSGQNAIQAGLYSAASGEESDTTLTGVYLWGLEAGTEIAKEVLIDSANVSGMYIPTDLDRDTTSIVLREKTGPSDLRDTMVFVYERHLNYVSGECGFSYNLKLDTVLYTINLIDSIVISYPDVLYNETLENVKIYIEP